MDTEEIYIVTNFTCMNTCKCHLIMHVNIRVIFHGVIVSL